MITQDDLKKHYKYSKTTGIFIRITTGKEDGTVGKNGYRVIGLKSKLHKAHRLAWLYVNGSFPDGFIDHINHDGDDNRFVNLRVVDRTGNARNTSKPKDNTSGVVGVNWKKNCKRWVASIRIGGKSVHLGTFEKFSEAVDSRKLAEVAYGFHKNHGLDK